MRGSTQIDQVKKHNFDITEGFSDAPGELARIN